MERQSRKQSAKKGWVSDIINQTMSKVFTYISQNMHGLESNLLNRLDIIEEVLIQKLNITRKDLNGMISFIDERNKKDNSIIEKYINKEDMEYEKKLEAMITDGLSDKGQEYAKHIIESYKKKI